MNPKISITVDAKNKAIASLTGMVTVGAKVDVEVRGIVPDSVPDWAEDDDFSGKSLRFRVVDECGHDLVRFPLIKKEGESLGDAWTVTEDGVFVTQAEVETGSVVNFNTHPLRKVFHGVTFNDSLEFGVILDSIVDDAQYAVGRIKVRQWSACPTDDPTILPDWRKTLRKLAIDLAEVEQSKVDAENAKDAAVSAKNEAINAKDTAQSLADAALEYKNSALSSAESAADSASSAASSASSAATSADEASASASQAAEQVEKYPKIDDSTNHWLVWDASSGQFVDTGISAAGPKGDKGDDGVSPHVGQNGHWFVGDVDTGVSAQGPKGDDGEDGAGVPPGGSQGQVLVKKSEEDFDTEWEDPQSAGEDVNAVHYYSETKTDAEKAQARRNTGSLGLGDSIPQSQVTGLTDALDAKRDKADLDVYTSSSRWTPPPESLTSLYSFSDQPSWSGNDWIWSAVKLVQFEPTVTFHGVGDEGSTEVMFVNFDDQVDFESRKVTEVEAKPDQALAAIATDSTARPENNDMMKYDATNDRMVKAEKSSSSDDPSTADYRDPIDNTCHKTEYGEWSIVRIAPGFEIVDFPVWSAEAEEWRYAFKSLDDQEVHDLSIGPSEENVTALSDNLVTFARNAICTDGEKFATSDYVKNIADPYVITDAVDGGVSVKINGETVTAFADLLAKCKTGRAVLYGQATTVETGYAFYTAASVTDSIIQFQVSGMLYDKSNIRYGLYVRRIKIVPRANGGLLVDDSGLEGPFAKKNETYSKGVGEDGSPADEELHDFFTATNGELVKTIKEEGIAPDAHLEIPTNERLKVVLADNSVAYDSAKALPYKFSSAIGDRVIATMTLTAASTDITLPTIAANDTTVKDFIIEVKNEYAVEGVATDAGVNIPRTDFKLVTRDGESLSAVTTVKAGKSAFICFTQKSPVVVGGVTYPCWFVTQVALGEAS